MEAMAETEVNRLLRIHIPAAAVAADMERLAEVQAVSMVVAVVVDISEPEVQAVIMVVAVQVVFSGMAKTELRIRRQFITTILVLVVAVVLEYMAVDTMLVLLRAAL